MKGAIYVSLSVILFSGLTQGCNYAETECADGSRCIPDYWICDGLKDCGDGSDEKYCDSCTPDKFDCNGDGSECVISDYVCDTVPDCKNGNDEKNCATTAKPQGPTGTPGPVLPSGCGGRKFEHDLTDQQTRQIAPLVVGGMNAVRGSLPWQVSVQMYYGFHFCGGTVIGSKWILSAAHCFSDGADGVVIVAGEHNLGSNQGSEQKIKVDRAFVHPNYNGRTQNNDIALIKLKKDLVFDDYTQPACIPTKANEGADYAPGDWLTISGWGSVRQSRGPQVLQVATVPMIAQGKCEQAYPGMMTSSMFCAGKLGVGGTDTCQGDSGGPVVKKVDGQFTVVGVVSWGVGCARPDKPGVYTRVARFENWVKNTMWNHK